VPVLAQVANAAVATRAGTAVVAAHFARALRHAADVVHATPAGTLAGTVGGAHAAVFAGLAATVSAIRLRLTNVVHARLADAASAAIERDATSVTNNAASGSFVAAGDASRAFLWRTIFTGSAVIGIVRATIARLGDREVVHPSDLFTANDA
jgi:hypothetical protein